MATLETAHYTPTILGLATTLGISAAISVTCVVAFEVFRRRKSMQYLFVPRTRLRVNPTNPIPLYPFSWLVHSITLPEHFYLTHTGLDTTMYLRFLKMAVHFLLLNGIIVCCALLPIHWYAQPPPAEWYDGSPNSNQSVILDQMRSNSTLAYLNVSNVPEGSNLLWAHLVMCYVITISWLWLLFTNYWDYMNMFRIYMSRLAQRGDKVTRTVMVSHVPHELRNDASLAAYFNGLGFGEVEEVRIVRMVGKLERKMERRERTLVLLEKSCIELGRNVVAGVERKRRKKEKRGKSKNVASLGSGRRQEEEEEEEEGGKKTLEMVEYVDGKPPLPTNTINDPDQARHILPDKQLINPSSSASASIISTASTSASMSSPIDRRMSATSMLDLIIPPTPGLPMQNHNRFSTTSAASNLDPTELWRILFTLPTSSLTTFTPTHAVRDLHLQLPLLNRTVSIPTTSPYHAKKVPSIPHYAHTLASLTARISELRNVDVSARYYKPTGTAFVTFKDWKAAQVCAQSVVCWKPGVVETSLAPEPRDLLWRNLMHRGTRGKLEGAVRQFIVLAAVWALTIFWLSPISFILGLTSLEALSQHFKFLAPFLDTTPIMRTFIQTVLPTLLISLAMSLLPWILMELSKQQHFSSYSALEDAVLQRYYHFSIFNVLIVFLLGTTFLNTIIDLVYTPTSILTLLANSLPQGANFFVNYVVFNTCAHAMELVQLGSQLFGHFFATLPFIAITPRVLSKHTRPWWFPFYYYYPNHILVFVIVITYSLIQPLIIVFGLLYFAIALVVFKYQFAFAYVRRYESGGKYYRRMLRYTSDGLIVFQLLMIGLFYLKKAVVAGTLAIPLLVLTGYCKIYLRTLFRERCKFLAVDVEWGEERGIDERERQRVWEHAQETGFIGSVERMWKWRWIKEWWRRKRGQRLDDRNRERERRRKEEEGRSTGIEGLAGTGGGAVSGGVRRRMSDAMRLMSRGRDREEDCEGRGESVDLSDAEVAEPAIPARASGGRESNKFGRRDLNFDGILPPTKRASHLPEPGFDRPIRSSTAPPNLYNSGFGIGFASQTPSLYVDNLSTTLAAHPDAFGGTSGSSLPASKAPSIDEDAGSDDPTSPVVYASVFHSAAHELTTYPDDSTSEYETYMHPSFVTQLKDMLYLPKDPRHTWYDLSECVEVDVTRIRKRWEKSCECGMLRDESGMAVGHDLSLHKQPLEEGSWVEVTSGITEPLWIDEDPEEGSPRQRGSAISLATKRGAISRSASGFMSIRGGSGLRVMMSPKDSGVRESTQQGRGFVVDVGEGEEECLEERAVEGDVSSGEED